jgi:hypothetical protein
MEDLNQEHKEVLNRLYNCEYGSIISGKLLDEIEIKEPVQVISLALA